VFCERYEILRELVLLGSVEQEHGRSLVGCLDDELSRLTMRPTTGIACLRVLQCHKIDAAVRTVDHVLDLVDRVQRRLVSGARTRPARRAS